MMIRVINNVEDLKKYFSWIIESVKDGRNTKEYGEEHVKTTMDFSSNAMKKEDEKSIITEYNKFVEEFNSI